ncbi:MAG: DUF4115 domain-containing protein [Ignavibacteria bacterium]|nr:DUF4115 domain-containing protein [Ignavibacteria bacterium]
MKKARVEKGLSLEEVSEATKIRLNVLKAIEDGNFDFQPSIYMISFLKEYMEFLGINSDEYKNEINQIFKRKQKEIETRTEDELIFFQPKVKKKKFRYTAQQLNRVLIFIYGSLFLSVLAIIYFSFFYEKDEVKPFELSRGAVDTFDVGRIKTSEQAGQVITKDSILLEFIATDTVWINMIVDNKLSENIILFPQKTKVWKAGKFFRFTLGNAGGVIIRRDGKELPPLGARGIVVKSVMVTRDSIYFWRAPKPKVQTFIDTATKIISPTQVKQEFPNLRDTKKIFIR